MVLSGWGSFCSSILSPTKGLRLFFFWTFSIESNNYTFTIDNRRSVITKQQRRMHESNGWHSADWLPLVANDVVAFDRVQRNIVEATKNVYLLWLKYWNCWVSAARLTHRSHISPLLTSLLVLFHRAEIGRSIEATDRVDAIRKNSSRQSSSVLIHGRNKFPFVSCWIIYFNSLQRLVIFASKAPDGINFIFVDNNW